MDDPNSRPMASPALQDAAAASLLQWKALPAQQPRRTKEERRQYRAQAAAGPAEAARVGTTRDQRSNALRKAAAAGDEALVRAVLDAGAHVDAANEYGQSALHLAAMHGHVPVIAVLRDWGADAALPDNGGATPWQALAAAGHRDAACALLPPPPPEFGMAVKTRECRAAGAGAGPDTLPKAPVRQYLQLPADHEGHDSFFVDEAVSAAGLQCLRDLFRRLPLRTVEQPDDAARADRDNRSTAVSRRLFCDTAGRLRDMLRLALAKSGGANAVISPYIRFLSYDAGAGLAPHVDLSVPLYPRPSHAPAPAAAGGPTTAPVHGDTNSGAPAGLRVGYQGGIRWGLRVSVCALSFMHGWPPTGTRRWLASEHFGGQYQSVFCVSFARQPFQRLSHRVVPAVFQ